MADKTTASGATYSQAAEGYFEKRQLQRSAGFWGIWGIGIAAVISGQFSGWSYGLGEAGWGGMLVATIVIVVMYFGMLFSIGEMSAAMPHTGGAYSFSRAAMGPWGGFVTGLAETIEYVFTTGVVVLFSAGYANAVTDELLGFTMKPWMWWLLLYIVFVGLNSLGAETSFKFAIVVSVISIGIIIVFALLAIAKGAVDFGQLNDVGDGSFMPFGISGLLAALPFAMWFFLGIEELPLAAEEAKDPTRDIPKASVWGMITLVACAAVVFVLNPAVTGSALIGLESPGAADEPLLAGFREFMSADAAALLSAFALIGLLASLQGIMFAYGRNMYSLSRAGYYPKGLSVTGKNKTPWAALVAGAVIGFVVLVGIDLIGHVSETVGSKATAIVLYIAVWGAVISYVLQMISFVLLRRKFPTAKRPYVSPVGVPGAIVAGVIATIVFIGILINPDFRPAIIAIAVVYAVALLVFGVYGRHNLVLSPEEEYALTGGLHGVDLEAEGLGGTIEDEILKGHTE